MNFCKQCGAKVSLGIPENDNRQRFICTDCGIIHYENPNIVAGVLPVYKNVTGDDKILLCKRAIDPRYGLWTLPAGFILKSSVETTANAYSTESKGFL